MGVQNAAAQRLAVPDMTTTVLTRTLTGLASESALAGGAGAKAGRRIVAVAAMLFGALCGGLLALHVAVAAALLLALLCPPRSRSPLTRRADLGPELDAKRSGRSAEARRHACALLDRQRPFHARLAVARHRAEELVRARFEVHRQRSSIRPRTSASRRRLRPEDDAIVTLCGTDDMFVNAIDTFPAFAESEFVSYSAARSGRRRCSALLRPHRRSRLPASSWSSSSSSASSPALLVVSADDELQLDEELPQPASASSRREQRQRRDL